MSAKTQSGWFTPISNAFKSVHERVSWSFFGKGVPLVPLAGSEALPAVSEDRVVAGSDQTVPSEPQTASVRWLEREFDEHPARGLTPARLASIMLDAERGDLIHQLELADDMEERDAHLYAELGKRRGAITALPWSIEPPQNATAAEKALTDRVRELVGLCTAHAFGVDGDAHLVISTMCDAMLKGFAAQEMVWGLQADGSGRRVQVPHITAQPQRWFTTSADRRRFLLRSRDMTAGDADLPPVSGQELQPWAWLMHVHPARNGYLARMSLARVLFWPYLFKNYAVRDLAEFLEIYGLPLRLGKYPAGASDAEKMKLLQAVTQIGHNAAGIIPQSMALEFQAAAAGTEVPFAAMWDRMDAAQSKAILGQTLSASEGQHGTQALGQVHNEVRLEIRNADAQMIAASFTRQLIAPLVAVNVPGADMRRLPRLVFDTGECEDLAAFADNLPKLASAGLQIGQGWVHEKLRIPKPAEGELVLKAASPTVPGVPTDPQQTQKAALAALLAGALPSQPTSSTDLIDHLVAEQVNQWQPLLSPLVAPLITELDKAVAAGESLEAFAARLPDLVKLMDAQPLTENLARAAFAAHLAGQADLELDPET